MEVLYKPDSIRLMRLLFAEAPRFPELGRAYRTRAKSVFLTGMQDFLERNVASGDLHIAHISVAAEHFQHLVMAARFFDVLLGTATVPDRSEQARITEEAIRLFMTRYGSNAKRNA